MSCRKIVLLKKILEHERMKLEDAPYTYLISLPACRNFRRGPYRIAVWHECVELDEHRIILQVQLYHCLGMSTMCSEGILVCPRSRRQLRNDEMYEYF